MNAPAEAFRFQALAKEIAAELRAKKNGQQSKVLPALLPRWQSDEAHRHSFAGGTIASQATVTTDPRERTFDDPPFG